MYDAIFLKKVEKSFGGIKEPNGVPYSAEKARITVASNAVHEVGAVVLCDFVAKTYVVVKVQGAKNCVVEVRGGGKAVRLNVVHEVIDNDKETAVMILTLESFLGAFEDKKRPIDVFQAVKELDLEAQRAVVAENQQLQAQLKTSQDEASANASSHAVQVLKLQAEMENARHEAETNKKQVADLQRQNSALHTAKLANEKSITTLEAEIRSLQTQTQRLQAEIKRLKADTSSRKGSSSGAAGGAAGAAGGAAPAQYTWATSDQFKASLEKIEQQAAAAAAAAEAAAEAEMKMLVESAMQQCDAEIKEYRELMRNGHTGRANMARNKIWRKYHPDKHSNGSDTLKEFCTRMFKHADAELRKTAPV